MSNKKVVPNHIKDFFKQYGRFGVMGGIATASKLTPEERREKARRAIQARWAKRKPPAPTT